MRIKKILLSIILIICTITLTGCLRDKIVYDGEQIKITFKVLDDYKLKTDREYFRNAREEAILVGNSFKIGIEVNNDLKNDKITFDEFKNRYKDREDYKEVKYSKIKGIQFYTREYLRYEIYLPINDKLILRLNIYSVNDNKKDTKAELESKDVKDILNHMKIEAK